MMGGGKGALSATVSTMQTTSGKGSMNGENETMQMMRQAVRQKMIASASMKKLVAEGGEVPEQTEPAPAPAADPRAAFKKRTFSSSMPAHIMRKDIESISGGDDTKAMGNILKGLDELSDEQSMNALRYIQFTCKQLGLDAGSLPCAQKVISAEANLKGTYNIVEEEEEELSMEDMVADGASGALPDLGRTLSNPV